MQVCYMQRIGKIQRNSTVNDADAVRCTIGERVGSVVDVIGIDSATTRH